MKTRTVMIGALAPWLLLASFRVAAVAQTIEKTNSLKDTSVSAKDTSPNHDCSHFSGECSCNARTTVASPSDHDDSLLAALQADLDTYLTKRATIEHISAVSLSVSLRGQKTLNLRAGTTEYGGMTPVPPNSLWQIGSNTKAFTAAMILQLEAEHVLSIQDRLGKWLPQYPAWREITIKQLLNMTSGIASYDEQPAFLTDYAAAPKNDFTLARLVLYAEGILLQTGWNYSNTDYQLAQMIIEKATNDTYENQLTRRFFIPLDLRNMFFRTDFYPPSVTERMPAGYFFDDTVPQYAPLLGMDVRHLNLSWAQSAGGIVASTEALASWDRALYEGCVLAPTQQAELESLVSEQTGESIPQTTPADSFGFGLGVQQQNASSLGIFWDYEGGTIGYRMLHLYLPGPRAVITVGLNSDPPSGDDQIGALGISVYTTLHNAGRL